METSPIFENRIDLTEIKAQLNAMKVRIGEQLVGQEKVVDMMIIALLAKGHVLLEGVPGVAKTLAAKLLAKMVEADFSRIQFTPDLMPSDVLGTLIFDQKAGEFKFKKGPIFTNMALIDEINRAPAKTQAALFEVMEEGQITNDGTTYPLGDPFMVLATQNPIEQEGTYPLPEAQLDRFMFKISVDYPKLEEEVEVLKRHHGGQMLADDQQVNALFSTAQLKDIRSVVDQVTIADEMFVYISKLVQESRKSAHLYYGASPRASLAIMKSAKVKAIMDGRDFVTPEDVIFVFTAVMEHRVMLTPEKEMEGFTVQMALDQIIKSVEAPR
ncbi:MoxR family ATPase [Persicobacter psychrovividus]|uniref:Magnesium chelatase n=1 Tax=Persicobacter psychrovividus TaxID=387638 RepID=A0ABM7VG16_9BACT|nr:magnesium chelatase [Persicobacter psychrovividus]